MSLHHRLSSLFKNLGDKSASKEPETKVIENDLSPLAQQRILLAKLLNCKDHLSLSKEVSIIFCCFKPVPSNNCDSTDVSVFLTASLL